MRLETIAANVVAFRLLALFFLPNPAHTPTHNPLATTIRQCVHNVAAVSGESVVNCQLKLATQLSKSKLACKLASTWRNTHTNKQTALPVSVV